MKSFFESRLINLVLFVIACSIALFRNWQADDLAWSLWLSNLFVTGALIVCMTALVAQKEAAFALIGAVLFVFAIAFHMGQTVPLFATVPFNGEALILSRMKDTYAAIFTEYWMWLPIAFYHCRDSLLHPPNPLKNDPKLLSLFKSIVFFNALIYILIGLHKLVHLNGLPAVIFVYFMYFFLFDRDFVKSRAKKA